MGAHKLDVKKIDVKIIYLLIYFMMGWTTQTSRTSQTSQTSPGRDNKQHWMEEDCDGRVQEMRWGRCKTNQRRTANGMVQYNAGTMSIGRSYFISEAYPCKFITIQGTKQTSEEDVVRAHNTKFHRVINFTAKKSKLKEYAGCAIMIPKNDADFIHTIGYSPDPELRGRVGYVRLMQQTRMDITLITVYIPVEGTRHDLTGKIWDWVEEIINKLGGTSQIYIGTDANGHTQGELHEQAETEEMPTIGMDTGNYAGQTTNWNGRRMITAMERHGMIAINTHYKDAGGSTYFTRRDEKEWSTRVDYILMQNNHTTIVKGCATDKRGGFNLQTSRCYRLYDHIPIIMNASFGAKLCSRKKARMG
jgi:exonuclease III